MTAIVTRKQAKENGSKFYFTGKPCHKGHIDYRHTSQGNCVTCRKEINKEAWANPEKRAKKKEAFSKVSREARLKSAQLFRDKSEKKEKNTTENIMLTEAKTLISEQRK